MPINYEKFFEKFAEDRLMTYPDDSVIYGWKQKTAGRIALTKDGIKVWVKIQPRIFGENRRYNERLWSGHEEIDRIDFLHKPKILEVVHNPLGDEREVKVYIMEYIPCTVISSSPEVTVYPEDIDNKWFLALGRQIEELNTVETKRIGFREEYIQRRILQYFPDAENIDVQTWVASHCDLHWANMTAGECYIIDWEAWGLAPKGRDYASLLTRSLRDDKLVKDIWRHYGEVLNAHDGRIAILHDCSEIMFMHETYGDYTKDTYDKAYTLGKSLV